MQSILFINNKDTNKMEEKRMPVASLPKGLMIKAQCLQTVWTICKQSLIQEQYITISQTTHDQNALLPILRKKGRRKEETEGEKKEKKVDIFSYQVKFHS